jgi:hypothetical protein
VHVCAAGVSWGGLSVAKADTGSTVQRGKPKD